MYDGVVNEAVPDDFMDLLRKMDDVPDDSSASDGKKSS